MRVCKNKSAGFTLNSELSLVAMSHKVSQAALSKGGTEGKERRIMAHFSSNCLLSSNWSQK